MDNTTRKNTFIKDTLLKMLEIQTERSNQGILESIFTGNDNLAIEYRRLRNQIINYGKLPIDSNNQK